MAYKEVSDLSTDTTISLGGTNRKTGKANPKSIEGYYLGKRQVDDKKKKSGFSFIYVLQTPKGNVGVWGKTDLDRKMGSATPGHMLRLTHSGMVQTPNGEMYKYKVEFDSENTIEVTEESRPVGISATDAEDVRHDQELFDGPEVEENEVEEEEDEDDVAATLLAAERKAKVEALLKNAKAKSAKN